MYPCRCANTCMPHTLRDLHASGHPKAGTHTHTFAHVSRHCHACIVTDAHTHAHYMFICTHARASHTWAHTNTNWWLVRILCLKKTCDCIKNVGHIGQIIKVRSEAVGLLAALSGPPMLGCAQCGRVLYI